MQISLFESLSRRVGVAAITGYQKHLSPYKGFVCAHRVLHGGESCSQYIKGVVAQEGVRVAFVKSRERFQACQQAHLILRRSQAEEEESDHPTPETPPISGGNNTACVDCGDASCGCAELISAIPDSGCADCHALDCGGLDCGFLDCGGCGW